MGQKIRMPSSMLPMSEASGICRLKKRRSTPETKMSAATRPTNKAEIASIGSMMRSITQRFMAKRRSDAGAVLGDAGFELLVDRVGIAARLGDSFGALLVQRRDHLLPRLELVGRQRIDLMPGRREHLRPAGFLEVG